MFAARMILAHFSVSFEMSLSKSAPLGDYLKEEKIDARRVAARPGEARDRTKFDRIFTDAEDDRDRGGRSFGRERGRVARRGDHSHTTADQLGHQRRQAIEFRLASGTRPPSQLTSQLDPIP
jgi:hypothetical protein